MAEHKLLGSRAVKVDAGKGPISIDGKITAGQNRCLEPGVIIEFFLRVHRLREAVCVKDER